MAGEFDVARKLGGGKLLERVIGHLDRKKDIAFAGGLLGGAAYDMKGNGKTYDPPLTRDNFILTMKRACDDAAKPNRNITCHSDATKWVDYMLKKCKY